MKSLSLFSAALLALSMAVACQQEASVSQRTDGEIQTLTVIGPAPIQFEPITGSLSTKGTSVQDGNALLFNWAVGDTLGIFPNQGNQVEFPISVANGTTSASFDGGGWALRNNASYAAYYPFSVWNYHRDNETILLDYSGQVQDGNGSFAHLSAYDYLASSKTTPVNSSVTFQMERQGSILYIDIVVPEPETITALEVSCDEAIFTEKAALDISGNTPVVTPVEMTKTLRLEFVNTATTSNNETVRGYLAVQPVDFSAKTVKATLYTATGSYEAPVTSRVVNKGRAAFLRFSDDFTPVNIEFADAEVKRICVENWDTNGDGELSYKEAAAVTDLGTVFRQNNLITTFNELEFFVGLTSVPFTAFYYCSNLESVIIPEHVEIIESSSFLGANKLHSVIIPNGVTRIGNDAFANCESLSFISLPESLISIERYAFANTSLSQITIPGNVTSFEKGVFRGCCYLEHFDGKFASQDGRSLINNGVLIALAPYGLSEYMIPSNVTIVATESLSFLPADLKRIIIPEGVLELMDAAIWNCVGISSISLPNSLESLDEQNFTLCENLISFSGKFAYQDGRCLIADEKLVAIAPLGLTEFVIPDGVTIIGRDVFAGCSSLASIVLPDQITAIGEHAFDGTGIRQLLLPENLLTIDNCVFMGCVSLSEITIPASVNRIDSYAFYGCTGLTKITVNSVTPFEIGAAVFYDTGNCPIYVPNQSVDDYKAANVWRNYANRIFGIDVNGSVVGPEPQNPD